MTAWCVNTQYCFFPEIAAQADEFSHLLVPDDGCEYDQLIELNLDEVFFCLFFVSTFFVCRALGNACLCVGSEHMRI